MTGKLEGKIALATAAHAAIANQTRYKIKWRKVFNG
jgi:hypothetical protein